MNSTPTAKVDQKTGHLATLVYRLRQDIDLYRVVGLNAAAIKKYGISQAFWGQVQMHAHESVSLTVCKIFEAEKRNDLNSIPGIIGALPESVTAIQRARVEAFGRTYGVTSSCVAVRPYLNGVYAVFTAGVDEALEMLKTYRDQYGAHSQYRPTPMPSGPSLDEFDFAYRFYCLAREHFADTSPALMGRHVGFGTTKVLEQLGIRKPKFDFPPKKATDGARPAG